METERGKAFAAQFDADAIEQIIAALDDMAAQMDITARETYRESGVRAARPAMHDALTFKTISAHLRSLRV